MFSLLVKFVDWIGNAMIKLHILSMTLGGMGGGNITGEFYDALLAM